MNGFTSLVSQMYLVMHGLCLNAAAKLLVLNVIRLFVWRGDKSVHMSAWLKPNASARAGHCITWPPHIIFLN